MSEMANGGSRDNSIRLHPPIDIFQFRVSSGLLELIPQGHFWYLAAMFASASLWVALARPCRQSGTFRTVLTQSRFTATFSTSIPKATQKINCNVLPKTQTTSNVWKTRFFIPGRNCGLFRSYSITQKSSSIVSRPLNSRFFSANSNTAEFKELPILTPPSVGFWLLGTTALIYAVIVVGGVTRLTESGLSITEWKPVSGVIPPITDTEWEEEFTKYKATPEFKLLNSNFTVNDFKRIFYMEWGHRVLGRFIGLAFVGPLAYFALRKRIPPSSTKHFAGLAVLLGLQGALGWFMVKSGLEDSIMTTPGAVPRVSHYRLAAHLGAAFLLYGAMFISGHNIIRDYKFVRKGVWSGQEGSAFEKILKQPLVRRFRTKAWALAGLVFITAISGAFVAGLDAGLLYNEFPLMGGRLAPPADELMNPSYATLPDKSDLWWRNIFENPTTVQFNHRVLAMTTYAATGAMYWLTRNPAMRSILPAATIRVATGAFAVANLQVLLGISTLLYLVPVPLAAAHQAGSVALLSMALTLALTLRRPGVVAQLYRRRALMAANKPPSL